jgi:hypothetical protein
MSLATFKKKSIVAQHGTKISGKPPGGYWLNQGPFGPNTSTNSVMFMNGKKYYGPVGFSLNGGTRNVGYVGQSMRMSKNGTPFRGVYPRGWGGYYGQYYEAEPVFNSAQAETLGTQYKYIKPTVLSNFAMLRQKYKWAYYGQYPNYTVQPNYGTSNLSDNKSQGLYLHNLSAASDCVVDVNAVDKYVNHIKKCGPFNCSTTSAKYKYNIAAANGPYTKQLYQPQTSSQHTLRVQRKCVNPNRAQQPIPGPTNGDGEVCALPISESA